MEEFSHLPSKHYHALRNDIRSGDILLCSGTSVFSSLIQTATRSIWSHVAFILRIDAIDRIMVLESVESIGVRTVPLSNYVRDYNGSGKGYAGRLLIARHQDVRPENIANLSRFAIDLLGFPYRAEEIAHIATRISKYALGLPSEPIDKTTTRSFICSEYAYACFKSIGALIDYNSIGFIAPSDFAHSAKVKPISYLENDATPLTYVDERQSA